MAQELKGVEVMRTGTFRPSGAGGRSITITDDDLQSMVNNFNELEVIGGFTPMLKLGHADAQKFMGQKDGAPNLGIIKKLVKEGSIVLANFSHVPDAVVDLIKRKRFTSVSVEIIPRLEFEGKVFANVLTAVALLGAQLPAVKGLKDLASTLFTQVDVTEPNVEGLDVWTFNTENDDMADAKYTQEQLDTLIEAAVAKAVKEAELGFAEAQKGLTAEIDDLKGKVQSAQDNLRQFEDDVRKSDAVTLVDKAIETGKILPKQKDAAVAFAMNLGGKVKFADGERTMADLFAEFIDQMPARVDFKEHSQDKKGTDAGSTFDDPGEEVDKRTRELMSKNDKLTYADARHNVMDADADLKLAYFNGE
jgi:hypothetical protein